MLRFARPLPAVARVTSAFSKNDSQNLHLLRSFASGAKALKSAKNGAKAAGNAKIVAAKQAKAQQQQDVDPYMEAAATAKSDVPNTQTQKIVCSMTELSKKLPNGNFLFRNISLSFFQGAKIGVIGINGAGKSSLMKIIAGIDTDFEGEMKIADGFKVGYLAQEPKLDGEKTVRQVVDDSLSERRQLLHDYEEISAKMCEPDADVETLMHEQADMLTEIERHDLWSLDRRIDTTLRALRCPPNDAVVEVLSGGERRRIALACLLLQEPDMLLLDEPTNHLDNQSVAWLETYLQNYRGTVCAITHDRYFLDNVARWILEIDNMQCYPFSGNYSAWLAAKRTRHDSEQKKKEARDKVIERELEWIRRNNNRGTINKSRLRKYDELVEEQNMIENAKTTGKLIIPPGPRLGKQVYKVENLSKTIDGRLLLDNVSFFVSPGAVVGVVGPNGTGKTTLFKLLTNQLAPDTGTILVGETVKVGYVQQMRDALNPDNTLFEEIAQGEEMVQVGAHEKMYARSYVAQFNFKAGDQEKKIHMLSGGERNRVHLAKMLRTGCNVLLLDEPTNDLDVDTLRALEDALPDFLGSAIVISHDRWFLDRICTHILAFEGDGRTFFFEGNFTEYDVDRKKRLAETSAQARGGAGAAAAAAAAAVSRRL